MLNNEEIDIVVTQLVYRVDTLQMKARTVEDTERMVELLMFADKLKSIIAKLQKMMEV